MHARKDGVNDYKGMVTTPQVAMCVHTLPEMVEIVLKYYTPWCVLIIASRLRFVLLSKCSTSLELRLFQLIILARCTNICFKKILKIFQKLGIQFFVKSNVKNLWT